MRGIQDDIMSLEGGAPKTLSFDHKPSTMEKELELKTVGDMS